MVMRSPMTSNAANWSRSRLWPRSATRRMDEGVPAAIQNGGCGFWLVGGSTRMSLKVQKRPWCEKRCPEVHALVMIASFEARIGLVEWDREARELIIAITFANSEIEPALRQEVQSRGLLGQEHRIVPRQHHYGSAEPQRRGARREPRQQGEGGRDLVPAGEVVLNQERAVVAKRFRFDVEIDEVMKALAHRRAGTRAAGLRRTKNSKSHDQSPYSRRAPVLAR